MLASRSGNSLGGLLGPMNWPRLFDILIAQSQSYTFFGPICLTDQVKVEIKTL